MTDNQASTAIDEAVKTIEWTLANLESKLGAPVIGIRIDLVETTTLMSHCPKFVRRGNCQTEMTVDRAFDASLREDRRQHRKTKPRRPPSYWRRHREQKCSCGGYWFPHRRTGGACDHSTTASYYVARRHGRPCLWPVCASSYLSQVTSRGLGPLHRQSAESTETAGW